VTTVAPLRILLVEDNPGDVLLLQETLADQQGAFELENVERLAPALERLRTGGIHLVLLDLTLPDSAGLSTFTAVRTQAPDMPIVVLTGLSDEALAVSTVRDGAQDYLVKGQVDGNLLGRTIRYAFERKRTEAALRESEVSYRTLVERAPVGIYRSNPAGRFLAANAALVRMLGYDTLEEVQRLDMARDVYADPAERQRLLDRDSYTDREYDEVEAMWKRKDGLPLTVQLSIRAVRNVAAEVEYYETIVRDVTEQRRLQAQLTQAQKMEAIGRLAGGIAHDFNNLLTAVFGYVDLLHEELAANTRAQQDLAEIRKAAERAAGLTRQLLAFSRQQVLEPVVLEPNGLLEDFEKMLRRVIGEDVNLRLTLGADVGNVRADPGQLEQVILNLAVNARDAMPTGGKLTIETANAELSEQYAEFHQAVVPGRYVMLAVSDTGVGMSPEVRAKAFEPFFTTKERGKGTGLGLATVYGIVKQSGGYVWVYSEPGLGTTFKIYLPQVDAPIDAAPRAAELEGTLAGTETILLAEDDELLRPLARNLLERLGYTVLAAANAEEALALVRKHAIPIHLLVADVVMPGESGRQLGRRLAELRPETRVLYVSGYTDEVIVHHGMLEPGLNYLQKPFTPGALARKVREVLDSP